MIYTFSIGVSMGRHADGDAFVNYDVTDEEMALIEKCKEEGIHFEDCEELRDLHERVTEAADEQLHDDWSDFHDDELDDYFYEFYIDF